MEEITKQVFSENEYQELLQQAVAVINDTRQRVAKQVNGNITSAYWKIGKLLYEKKIESNHGSGVVKRLSMDLKAQYPSMGLSTRQMWNMKKFYLRYSDSDSKLLQVVAVLPWGHNLLLLNKKLNDADTLFYAEETVRKGWNRDLLTSALKMKLHEHKELRTESDNNFSNTLPAPQALYANEVFRSSYNLGFLGVTSPILELELERRLVDKVKLFLLELGKGFTFIGNQYELEYKGKTSRVDLLLFHRGLRSLVAIDLKIGEFKPEYAGKMNYYLSLLDRLERFNGENRSIGIILCAEKDHVEVEMALEDMGKPIGVADYQLIVPKEELKQVIESEIKAFNEDKMLENSNNE